MQILPTYKYEKYLTTIPRVKHVSILRFGVYSKHEVTKWRLL